MYEHNSYKKDVWTEFINCIEGMHIASGYKQSFMS